jgi:hypothetical protein
MYRYYPVSGTVRDVQNEEAQFLMNQQSSQWEDERTEHGILLMAVYDWASFMRDSEFVIDIPNLREGGNVALNTHASAFFGFEIYGDCFLKL